MNQTLFCPCVKERSKHRKRRFGEDTDEDGDKYAGAIDDEDENKDEEEDYYKEEYEKKLRLKDEG